MSNRKFRKFSYYVTFTVLNERDTFCKLIGNPYICEIGNDFTGVAHLHKGDKYDKKKGERIALLKARRKWHHAMRQFLLGKARELSQEANEVWLMAKEYGNRYGSDCTEIKQLVKEK
jgi:hypothetical protein